MIPKIVLKIAGCQSTPATQRILRVTAFIPSQAAQAMIPPTMVMTSIATINHSSLWTKVFLSRRQTYLLSPSGLMINRNGSISCWNVKCNSRCGALASRYKRLVLFSFNKDSNVTSRHVKDKWNSSIPKYRRKGYFYRIPICISDIYTMKLMGVNKYSNCFSVVREV